MGTKTESILRELERIRIAMEDLALRDKRVLNAGQVAVRIRQTHASTLRLLREGAIKGWKVDSPAGRHRTWRISAREVDRFLQKGPRRKNDESGPVLFTNSSVP